MGDEKEDKLGLSEAELTEVQKKTLDDLLRNYHDVLRDEPGLAKGVHHVIETGDSLPMPLLAIVDMNNLLLFSFVWYYNFIIDISNFTMNFIRSVPSVIQFSS